MSDGPYRVVQHHPNTAWSDVTGPKVSMTCPNDEAETWCHYLNAVHRAASEKAAKVVEAARELLRLDEDGYMMRDYDGAGAPDYEPMLEKMRSALADYDKGVSNEAS